MVARQRTAQHESNRAEDNANQEGNSPSPGTQLLRSKRIPSIRVSRSIFESIHTRKIKVFSKYLRVTAAPIPREVPKWPVALQAPPQKPRSFPFVASIVYMNAPTSSPPTAIPCSRRRITSSAVAGQPIW